MHFCPSWAKGEDESPRLDESLPPALAYGKLALLSKRLQSQGATLLPSMLRAVPSVDSPLALDPEACSFAADDSARWVVEALPAYSSRVSGPRFSLRYTFVPRCPGRPPPSWVHPSLLEPDPEPSEGVVVNGRVFPYEEMHQYCSRGVVNTVKYQAEDNAESLPHVHVVLDNFGKSEEAMMARLVSAHVKAKLTVDVCRVNGGSSWYRFTSCVHRREGLRVLETAPRLFTSTSRGGLKAVYERLLRKHVLFYDKMARGMATIAFNELEKEDVAQVWDKYGAKNVACVRAVAGGRPPLLWRDMHYKDREKAKGALAKLPWKTAMLKPAILSKKSWSNQHSRENARKSTLDGLSVPQIRLCATDEAMRQETMHYRRYPFQRKPILITDREDVGEDVHYEGVIRLGGDEVSVRGHVVSLPAESADALHADFLVQWFPLLHLRCDTGQEEVHPSVVEASEKYSAVCASKARTAAARMQDEEGGRERRKAGEEMREFERLSEEFEALKTFDYPGCRAGCS